METFVVGEEDCTFDDVVEVFFYELNSVAVSRSWRDFARELRINSGEIEQWRKDAELLDKLTLKDVLYRILESWKEKKGKGATLPNLLKHLEKVNLKNVADDLEEFFSTGNRVHKGRELFKSTLPTKPQYYIPRTLITRRVIHAKVFWSTDQDIFVVDGVNRFRLSQLAKKELTDTSANQVRKQQLSVRFILLERFGDWALLCGKTTNTIHLLRHHEGRFLWISTKGSIAAVQKAIDEENQNELSEEKFIREIETDFQFQTNQPICISDSPGMGKSLLLASIGRQLHQQYPQRCIAFIAISEFVVKIRTLLAKYGNTEKAVLEALSQMLCEDGTARKNFFQKLAISTEKQSTKVELMLDGFDEVSTENLDLAHECLDTLKINFNSAIRVWVTTRSQHLHELEQRFSVIGYRIQPFQEKHQIEFVTLYWNTKEITLDRNKLENFSKKCLSTLKTKLNRKDEDIAGIPLQCMLVAEVYMEDAQLFCDMKNKRLKYCPEAVPRIDVNSIADLYEKMIAFKIEKFIETYPLQPEEIRNVWPLHMYLALELIFPSHAHVFKDTLQIQSGLSLDYLVNIGILESKGSTKDPARFIHRTFAEYLSARFFVFNVIALSTADCNASIGLPKFLFEHVLECSVKQYQSDDQSLPSTVHIPLDEMDTDPPKFTWKLNKTAADNTKLYYECSFKHSVVCHFVDALLGTQTHSSTENRISQESANYVKDVMYACIHSDFSNIIVFLHSLKYPEMFCLNYFDSEILIDGTTMASMELLKFLLQSFEHEPLKSIEGNRPNLRTVLHAAVRRGSYSIFEYILKEHDFEDLVREDEKFLDLVYWTVENTADGDLKEIQDRIEIVTALYDLNTETINYLRGNEGKHPPLLAHGVNILLLKTLIDCGAKLLYVDDLKNTILHKATEYLSPTDYYDLLQFIPIQISTSLSQMPNDEGEACLHLIVKRGLATPDILNLILSNGFDINTSGKTGKTCIFYAVEIENENKRISTVKLLLEKGADATRVSCDGDSIVHYSAEMDRIDCLQFFLEEKNMNVNQINELNGDTPIFNALRNGDSALQTVQFLLEHGADYKILNSNGCNLLHGSAEYRQLECLELFLSLGGLDINQVDNDGDTPLLCALIEYDGNTVQMTTLLLGQGADHTISNKKGENVLHHLAENACAESLHHFVGLPSLGVNAGDCDNDTPLHIVFRNIDNYDGCFDDFNSLLHNIEELLSLGADVNAKNDDGETPLDIYEQEILEWQDKEELMQKDIRIRSLLDGSAGENHSEDNNAV